MANERKILIDGDYIVYAAGFAGQQTTYAYIDGGYVQANTITEIKDFLKINNHEFNPECLYSNVKLDPPEHVYHSAKKMLESAIDKCFKDCDDKRLSTRLYISGDGNFRHKIASIRPYKGTRVAPRPIMYNEIRAYLIKHQGAMVVHDQEPDDAVSIIANTLYEEAAPTPYIVGVDKDLLQIPGRHLNPNKGFALITKELGDLLVYRQCLTGDSVDNIGGCYKVGKKGAEIITRNMPNSKKWEVICEMYAASIKRYGSDIYNGLDPEEAAIENMQLVKLRSKPGEIWTPENL